jgi:hypothetical protein
LHRWKFPLFCAGGALLFIVANPRSLVKPQDMAVPVNSATSGEGRDFVVDKLNLACYNFADLERQEAKYMDSCDHRSGLNDGQAPPAGASVYINAL